MVDLEEIEKRLNSDQDFRQCFLKDPVGVLAQEGLKVSEKMGQAVQRFVEKIQEKGSLPPGSNLQPPNRGDAVMIGIEEDF
jgi:hypothetical protein